MLTIDTIVNGANTCYTYFISRMQGVLHVHVYIVPTMLTELLYTLQYGGTPLHFAAKGGHTTCVEHLLSAPGFDVNIKNRVSWSIE